MPVELETLSNDDLAAFRHDVEDRYTAFRQRNRRLDITRGKPAPEQLDLSNALLTLPGEGRYKSADGVDARNYQGGVHGLPEARALFAKPLGVRPEDMLVAGNSSLALMHDAVAYALLKGVPGGEKPWSQVETTFLCPVPGYDRHFAICESYGIRMVGVPLTGRGPDMDVVEKLVAEDPTVRGMWCVPKYSNPTGEIYAQETIERLAAMPTAAPDFRLFWDNAYAVHHLTAKRHEIADILTLTAERGHPDRAFVFGSTSKVTFAGAGLAFFASSKANLAWYAGLMGRRTIGPDKINQLRHVAFLRDAEGLARLMEGHRALIAPKFALVQDTFRSLLGGTGAAVWTEPEGGYFINLDVRSGCAKRTVELAEAAGIALVPAGATFPYGRDPDDRNIRIAPTYPSLSEVGVASEGIALSVLLAVSEAILAERRASDTAAA